MKETFKKCLSVFWSFFKIGAFTFGGGYAMVPLIQKEAVEKKGWITDDDILEILAIAESTPGPIAINSATFVGYRTAGFFGAMFATIGVVLPSFAVILVISYILEEFQQFKPVEYAFFGIRAGVLALVLKALWTMYTKCPKGLVSYIVLGAAFVLAAFTKINVIFVIIGCALFGLITALMAERRDQA
ncbi:MAG: chromate transporter [Clostridia bacterium]|nr:chromate transporter [Clostridia bacterium]